MKVIIAGSRDFYDGKYVNYAAYVSKFSITEVVCGNADGVDTLGAIYGHENKIPVKYMLADWKHMGRKAGIVRNIEMGKYADALIALWDGESRGTAHMIEYMTSRGKPVEVISTLISLEEYTNEV